MEHLMSFAYFLFSLLFAWLAYNLYRPEFEKPRLAVLSFMAGWLVGELALFFIAGEILITLLFSLAGGTEGFWGACGFLLSIAAWLAMGVFFLRSFKAGAEMEIALVGEFGSDFDKEVKSARIHSSENHLQLMKLLKPFAFNLPQVKRLENVTYGEAEGLSLKLDIYHHHTLPQNAPVLFQIHGGGWTHKFGSKNEQARPLMSHLAANGWVCVSVDYRLSPQYTFPAHIIDCKSALVWVKENIAQYGGNADFIIATGGSAGGHLCSLLALTPNQPQFQPGFEQKNTQVQGCVPFYGVYDFTNHHDLHANDGLYKHLSSSVLKKKKEDYYDDYKGASPMFQLNEQAPPFLIIQGSSDTLVSCPEAQRFAANLKETSNSSVIYAELSDAQHAFDIFHSVRSEQVKFAVERYLNYLHYLYIEEQQI